jgi:hypothetical protein
MRCGIDGRVDERSPSDDLGEIGRHSDPRRSAPVDTQKGRKRASRAAIGSENGVGTLDSQQSHPHRFSGLFLDFSYRGWWPALRPDAQTLIPRSNLDLTGTHRSVHYFKALVLFVQRRIRSSVAE